MVEKKAVHIIMEIKLWQSIKAKAAQRGLTLQEYVTDILKDSLKNNGIS